MKPSKEQIIAIIDRAQRKNLWMKDGQGVACMQSILQNGDQLAEEMLKLFEDMKMIVEGHHIETEVAIQESNVSNVKEERPLGRKLRCPNCNSENIRVFNDKEDICDDCNKTFPGIL
jgi:hypothetical protein